MRASPDASTLRRFCLHLLLPLVILTSAATLCGQTVSVVQTNPDQSARLSPQPAVSFVPGTGGQLAINVDDTVRYQRLEGVGASFTDSARIWSGTS